VKSVLHVLTTTAFLVGIFSTIVRAEPPFELWGARWRQTSPALLLPQRRDHALTAQVETDLRNAQRSQTKGDLTAARNSAISAWIEADIEHSIPTTSRSLNPILLFPEGDALHFFAWNTATELVYIDLSHDIVKLAACLL